MPNVTFLRAFSFAEDGINQKAFLAGDTHDVSQSCADSAAQVGALIEPDAMENAQDVQGPSVKGKPGRKPKPRE